LFVVDAVDVDPVSASVPTGSEAEEEDRDEDGQSGVNPQTPNSESEPGSEEESEARSTPAPLAPGSRKKGPAWVDPDDSTFKFLWLPTNAFVNSVKPPQKTR
jgi:hypothetical protein